MLTEPGAIKECIIHNTSNPTQVVFSVSPLQTDQHLPLTNCGDAFPRFQFREYSNLHLDDISLVQVSHQFSLATTSLKLGSKPSVPRSSLGEVSVVTIPYYCFRSYKLYMFRITQRSEARKISARVNRSLVDLGQSTLRESKERLELYIDPFLYSALLSKKSHSRFNLKCCPGPDLKIIRVSVIFFNCLRDKRVSYFSDVIHYVVWNYLEKCSLFTFQLKQS